MTFSFSGQSFRLFGEFCNGGFGVAVQIAFARKVTVQLLDTGNQRFDGFSGLSFFGVQAIALNYQALQHSGGNRFFFTQRRQGCFG